MIIHRLRFYDSPHIWLCAMHIVHGDCVYVQLYIEPTQRSYYYANIPDKNEWVARTRIILLCVQFTRIWLVAFHPRDKGNGNYFSSAFTDS